VAHEEQSSHDYAVISGLHLIDTVFTRNFCHAVSLFIVKWLHYFDIRFFRADRPQGCKKRLDPFPGQISHKLTKPGLNCLCLFVL